MEFNDESLAKSYLSRISYFRLKYFWPDLIDNTSGDFKDGTYFEDIIERYEFDKSLRGILFNAIETLEIGLRAKIISTISVSTYRIRFGGNEHALCRRFEMVGRHLS